MTSEAEYLTVFRDELPDAGVLLYSESMVNGCPVTFTLFPKLPSELRLRVWRATFPPKKRRILKQRFKKGRGRVSWSLAGQLPCTAKVNHESRVETLRCYKLLIQRNAARSPSVYFLPAADTIVLEYRFDVEDLPMGFPDSSILQSILQGLKIKDIHLNYRRRMPTSWLLTLVARRNDFDRYGAWKSSEDVNSPVRVGWELPELPDAFTFLIQECEKRLKQRRTELPADEELHLDNFSV